MNKATLVSSELNCLKETRYGYFLYNKNDKYIGQAIENYGEYSQHEITLFDQLIKSGDTVLDVGANLGAFTLYFARKVGDRGRVYAFEPQPFVFHTLAANMALNNIYNARCHWCGLGAEAGIARVPDIDYSLPSNNYGGISLKMFDSGEPVEVKTLDSLGLQACNFMKIDVEGMESEVLRGGIVTIEKYKPIIFVENDRKEHSDELIKILVDWGYKLYWYNPPLFNADNYYKNSNNIYGNIVTKNMLCLPAGSSFDPVDFDPVDV